MRFLTVTCAAFVSAIVLAGHISPAGAEGFIAGTTPDRRPEGAPILQFYPRSAEWYARSLQGVSRPYPPSLVFLDNQGGWFNPFQHFHHKGMPPPYDPRGLHDKK